MKTKIIQVCDLVTGDTVVHNGETFTFNKKDHLNSCPLMGMTVKGQRFPNGIEVVLYPNWYKGEILNYVTQR